MSNYIGSTESSLADGKRSFVFALVEAALAQQSGDNDGLTTALRSITELGEMFGEDVLEEWKTDIKLRMNKVRADIELRMNKVRSEWEEEKS